MKRPNADSVIAAILLLLGGVMYWNSYTFRVPPFATMSPRDWPRFVIVLLLGLSAVYLLQSVRAPPSDSATEARQGLRGWVSANRNALWCFGLFFAFLITLPYIGMLVGGTAFVFLAQTAVGERGPRAAIKHLLIAVISVGLMWGLFEFAMDVLLPTGSLFGNVI